MESKRERFFAMVICIVVSGLVIDDVIEDLNQGSSVAHVTVELFIVALCLIGFL